MRWLIWDQFRSDQRIARVTVPLLIMHGSRDAVIPIALGERMFALAHQPKQFVRFDGGGHDDLDNYGAPEAAHRFIEAAAG
jgi:pimeloyl-ACP methyl ester carboxylesterase